SSAEWSFRALVRARASTLCCSPGAVWLLFFFFQAEDGIRDLYVTGVQTCALPICPLHRGLCARLRWRGFHALLLLVVGDRRLDRSEERRVGKECRSRWWPEH